MRNAYLGEYFGAEVKMNLKTVFRIGFLALVLVGSFGCTTKNLTVAEVAERLLAKGVTVATEGTMFPMVGGKDCLSATWLRLNGYQAMALEYKDKESARNAKFQIRNAVQSVNFLFAPPGNVAEPLPENVLSGLNVSLEIDN